VQRRARNELRGRAGTCAQGPVADALPASRPATIRGQGGGGGRARARAAGGPGAL